jgi:colanic acid/amylovoran biosynthesis glycosyltransferase
MTSTQTVDRRQTVAHVVPAYLPRSATFIYTQLRFQARYQPIVLARRTENLSEFPLEAPIVALDSHEPADAPRFVRSVSARLSSRRYARRLAEEARRHRAAAVHAHFGWSGPPALQAHDELGIPLVTTFYGRDLAETKPRLAREHPYRALFARGTLFCCEGPAMGEKLRSIGCPSDRIRLVRIGLDLEHFPFVARRRTKPFIVIQTARLVEKKGVDLSIRAFAEAQPSIRPSELWIVGDGPDRELLERLVDEVGIRESVRFFGEVTHEVYRDLLPKAHLCLQPSRTASDGDTEGGAPTVLLEMQASGLLVVATTHADIPNVVSHSDQLAPEEDVIAIAAALARTASLSDEEWQARAAEARTFVEEHHDARLIARQIEDLYSEARDLL